ncbi:MAG: hypothetical protein ACRBN8_11055 [Nannocystales bacterium]
MIEFAAELADLALYGASVEEVDAFNDQLLMAATDAHEPDDDGITPRASGSWETCVREGASAGSQRHHHAVHRIAVRRKSQREGLVLQRSRY